MGIRIGDTPLDLRTQDDYNALAAQNEASLVRGLRSGTYSAGGQLRALAGGVGEALGANAFATGQYARAKELGLRAQEEAPLVSNYKDINSLGSLGSYLAGKLGQAGPSLAAGLGAMALTDGAAIPALLAATAGNAPLEIGSAIQRQQEDPVARQHSALARLGLAGGEGVASSALQNIVPVAMGGKLLGRVAENVGNQSLKQILARNVGEAVVGNAVAGGAAERLHQGAAGVLNPNRDTSGDAEAVKDAMIEGGLTGLPFAAAGAGGEAMHGNTDKISQGVRDAAGSVKDRLSPARRQPGGEAAPEAGAGPEVPPNGPTPSMYSFDLFGKKRQRDVDLAQKMAADQETVDPSVAGAGPAAQDKAFADDLKMRADKAMQWVQDIINDPTTLPEAKQQAMEWAQNITDRASQVGIAGLKLAQEKTRAATQAVNSFADRVSEQWGDLVERGKTIDPLRNQQADRLDQSVIETIVPMLQDKHPGLLDNQQAVAQLGDALRKQIVAIAEGDNRMFDKRASDHLYEIFGDDIHTVYDQLFETFSPTLKPQQRERVLGAINDMVAKEQERMPLRDVVMKNLRPELQGTVTTSQARAAADMLGRYTRGELTDPKATPAEHARNERLIRQQLESYFGGRTDAVLKVAEKQNKPVKTAAVGKDDVAGLETENAGKQYSGEGDAREHTLETQTADERLDEPTYYGTGKERNKPFLNESANTELYGNAGATKRVLDQARADHPGQHVEVIPLEQHLRERGLPKTEVSKLIGKEDPANYSMVKVHPGERSDTHLSPDEVSGMYLDAKNHGDSKARIDTDGKRSLDAHAIVKTMLAKFKREGAYSEGDDKGYLHMVARAFHEGIGSYIEHRANETAAKEVNRWAHAALENPDVHHMTKAKLRRLLDSNEPTARDVLAKMYEADTGDKAADAVRGADGLFPGLKRDKNGRPVFPDDLVLQFKKGGNSITYGDIKGLEYSPARGEHEGAVGADRTPAQLQRSLDKVQMRMADIKAAAEKLGKPDNPVDQQRMDELYAKWDDLRRAERGLQEALDKRADAEHAQSLKDAEGRSAVGKDENIHRATLEHGEDVAVRKDEAGNTLTYANSTKKAELGIESLKTRFKAVAEHGTAPQKALANKALALLDHFDQLPDAAAKAIVAMKDAKKFSEVADTINRLYEKYGEGLPGKSEAQFSKQAVSAGPGMSPAEIKQVGEYIDKVLGKSVERYISGTMQHSGEFFRKEGQDHLGNRVVRDVIRISTHAFDPMSVAAHESFHAFFEKLRDTGNHEVMQALYRAANSVEVMDQLRGLLKGDRNALRQIDESMEERTAYMYQFWANGALNVNPKTKSVFTRIANMVKHALGIWTDGEHAQHIMEYFHRGDYVPNMHDRSVVAKALMEPSTNRAVEAFKSMAKPLIDMHNSILATGDQRMRKLENPALTRIADLVYREHAAVGQDQGYVPAWTQKRLQVLNKFIDGLNGVDSAHFAGAIEALQQNLPGRSPQERKTIAAVRNTLDHMFQYLRDSGLNIGDMGAGKNYFPRMWDSDSIRGNPNAFELMLLKNGVEAKAAQKIVEKLTAEVDPDILMSATGVPAFHSGNERVLRDLPDAEVAPFLKKDLIHTMNTYITQAVRRAEYVKRFGEDGKKLAQMLRIAKERYGASDGDLEMARKYIAGVDGTLGNNISPGLNKLFGNIQVYQNIRLLPLAIFSSVIDPGGIIVRGGTVGDAFRAFKRGIMEVPRGFKDNPKNDYWTDIAETIGAIESKALLHAIGSQQSVGLGASAAKLNNLFFKINLMEQFNQSMRVAATEAAARFITKHNDGKASPHSERWLTELGMRAGDAKTDAGGNLLITRQQFIDAGYSQAEAEKRSIQMGKAVNKWVDGAILRPNEAHKAIWMNDPHWRLVAHLKQFVFAFQHAMIDRVLEEAKYGNYKPAAAITSFVPVMMASDMLRGMLTNGGQLPAYQQDWDAEDFLWNGVQRAGLLGVGQFRADMFKSIRRGGDGIGALSGPTIEQLTDGIRAIGGGDAGGTVMKALPANALYSHYLGHSGDGGPMFMD